MACYEDIIATENNHVKCTLCDEQFEDKEVFIEAHITNSAHKKLYMKRIMNRNSVIIRNSTLYCSLCDREVGIADLIDHVHSRFHGEKIKIMQEIVSKDGGLIDLPNTWKQTSIHCIICDNEVEFTLASVRNHVTSEKHVRAKAMVVQPLNGIFSVDDNKYLWCKLCQKYFDNYIEVIFEHIESKEHTTELNKILFLIGDDIDIEKYLQSLTEDKTYCKKCSIEVPYGVDNLQRHVKGRRHTRDD